MADELRDALTPTDEELQVNNGILGALGTAYLLKIAAARSINTLGFGNLAGSYESTPKPQQYLDDINRITNETKRLFPREVLRTMSPGAKPVELLAASKRIKELEKKYDITRKGKQWKANKRIPKSLAKEYESQIKQFPRRKMAQAIISTSLNAPINFQHGGKIIENAFPQDDPLIRKSLLNKGLDVTRPIPVYDVSANTKYVADLRKYTREDLRVKYISDLLANNKINEAKIVARKGQVIYKGAPLKTKAPGMQLIRTADNGVLIKFNPHYFRGRNLSVVGPVKDYVIGGHTQWVKFGRIPGRKGLHKINGGMYDITTYASHGEKVRTTPGIAQKTRVALGGRIGQELGIHRPVVTQANIEYKAPGRGRPKGSFSSYPKGRKGWVESGKTYKLTKELAKKALMIASRGKIKL